MSKITNVRFPGAAMPQYNPQQFNDLANAIQLIVRQLNSSYTPQSTENNQSALDWFSGSMGMANRGVLEDFGDFSYGAFLDFTDQTQTTTNTAKTITWGTTAYSKHISIGSPTSRIVFAKAGKYYIHFTAQLNSQSANAKTFWFWPRINGSDITGSTMRITLHDNDEAKTVARAAIFEVDKGDYLEAMWAADSLDTSLEAYAAESFCPGTPSVTLMIQGIEHG
jgi:uncharacterized protein YjdB